MRFVMRVEMTEEHLAVVKKCDLNCYKHISIVKDIYIWEKGRPNALNVFS